MNTSKTCPCKWCGRPTPMLGTQECDNCHEVRLRVEFMVPEVLARIIDLRPEVLAFARLMEENLRKHDGDRGPQGWKGDDPFDLVRRIVSGEDADEGELVELECALREWCHRSADQGKALNVAKEAADVANFCMMIADVVGGLTKEK